MAKPVEASSVVSPVRKPAQKYNNANFLGRLHLPVRRQIPPNKQKSWNSKRNAGQYRSTHVDQLTQSSTSIHGKDPSSQPKPSQRIRHACVRSYQVGFREHFYRDFFFRFMQNMVRHVQNQLPVKRSAAKIQKPSNLNSYGVITRKRAREMASEGACEEGVYRKISRRWTSKYFLLYMFVYLGE